MKKIFGSGLTYVVILAILLIAGYIGNINLTNRIRKSHVIVCGTVLEMRAGKGVNAIFSYVFNGKRYEFNESSPKKTYENYKKGDNSLLIAIDKDNPKYHVILSKDEDYEWYFIKPEDTVNVRCQ